MAKMKPKFWLHTFNYGLLGKKDKNGNYSNKTPFNDKDEAVTSALEYSQTSKGKVTVVKAVAEVIPQFTPEVFNLEE